MKVRKNIVFYSYLSQKRQGNRPERPSFDGNVLTNPNINAHFWKERCEIEDHHKFKSNVKGVYLGKINYIPVTDKFAYKVHTQVKENPLSILEAINKEESFRKVKFPGRKLFGTNRANKLVLPIEARNFKNLPQAKGVRKVMNNYKSSVKTYDEDNQMSWMQASINLAQPEMK